MDPWGATVIPEARRALRQLAGTPGVHVALLSGRTALDLASRARVGGAIYLGNHGVERGTLARGGRAETMRIERDPALESYVEDAQVLADRVASDVPEAWMVVERKGPSVAFHFRAAPDLVAARDRVLEAVERADTSGRLVRFPGRRVVELRPPGAAAKRDALRLLIEELRPATTLVLGDDAADADAFMVLRELRDAAVTDGFAVAVHAHAEMPEPVAAAADVALASPIETARFLAGLARAIRARPQAVTAPPCVGGRPPTHAPVPARRRAAAPRDRQRRSSRAPPSAGTRARRGAMRCLPRPTRRGRAPCDSACRRPPPGLRSSDRHGHRTAASSWPVTGRDAAWGRRIRRGRAPSNPATRHPRPRRPPTASRPLPVPRRRHARPPRCCRSANRRRRGLAWRRHHGPAAGLPRVPDGQRGRVLWRTRGRLEFPASIRTPGPSIRCLRPGGPDEARGAPWPPPLRRKSGRWGTPRWRSWRSRRS